MRHALLFALTVFAVPALAQSSDAPRYTMTPIEGGVIRLDTQTGQISTCKLATADLICRSASDERAGLEDEIIRLNQENNALKQRLATANPRFRLELPDDRDVDHALGIFDKFMRRFKGIVDDWRHEGDGSERT